MGPLLRIFIWGAVILVLVNLPAVPEAFWPGSCRDQDGPTIYIRCHSFRQGGFFSKEINYQLNRREVEETVKRYGYSKEEFYQKLKRDCGQFQKRYPFHINIVLKSDGGFTLVYPRQHSFVTQQFKDFYEEERKIYLKDHMITFLRGALIPDYRAVQLWQAGYIQPLYKTLEDLGRSQRMNEREFTELIARFVQGLDYKVPREPRDKTIIGFWPPLVCLKEKAGDCDTKSTLFATLYYHFKKNASLLIMTQRHGFIGLKNQHKIFPTDRVLNLGGVDYTFLESTRYNPIGNVRVEDLENIKRGQFHAVFFH